MWYEVELNGCVAFMLVTNGEFVGYYDIDGNSVSPHEGTSVHVTHNDVAGPFNA